jgi:alpha-L-arabinofuranosidase
VAHIDVRTRDPAAQRLTVSVVNRDPDRALATRIGLQGAIATGTMTVSEVNAAKPDAVNSFGQPDNVAVRRAVREVHGSHLDVTFAPHSFTVCEVSLA